MGTKMGVGGWPVDSLFCAESEANTDFGVREPGVARAAAHRGPPVAAAKFEQGTPRFAHGATLKSIRLRGS